MILIICVTKIQWPKNSFPDQQLHFVTYFLMVCFRQWRMGSRRPERLPIFVRLNSNINIPVQVDLQWNIARLKQEIAAQQGVDPTEMRIIFAGRELKDDLQLKVSFILKWKFAGANCNNSLIHFANLLCTFNLLLTQKTRKMILQLNPKI